MEKIKTSLSIGENEMTTISEEEENFVRMNLLLTGISTRAVRVLFNNEFHPSNLDVTIKKEIYKLNDLKKKKIINQPQWEFLFPRNSVPDSNMFDITLMITLLTNLTGLNHYDKLPLVTDTTPAADLGRMKYYRNHISHNKDGKLENTFFSIAWNDIIEAVYRLGGQSMLDECKELRTKILDQSTVPWNIRDQISKTLKAWKLMNFKFVGTKASQYVFECLQKHRCVTITASSGVGKTATLRHVAIQMEDEGYNVLLVTTPCDIVKFNNPNKKNLFVMDDFCGTYSINQTDLNILEPVMESIKDILIRNKTTKIIVACRLQVYQDNKFESLSLFRTCVCNLQSKELCLSQTEKQSIAEQYIDIKSSNISMDCVYDCFPLLCKLYSSISNSNITDFFQYPFSVFELEIDKLHKNGHFGKYCALALCVMFNNRLEEEWFTDETDKEIKIRITNTYEACKLNRGTSRLTLLDEMKSLIHTFMIKEQDVYTCIHGKIFDFLTYYFGKNMIQCVIKNADSRVISQRLLLEKRGNIEQFITVVPFEYHQMYRERILYDWSKGRVQHVFNNINLKIQEIRQRFLCYLKALDISSQRQLALTCDVDYKDTVLLQCCSLGDIPLITWCIHHGVDPNQCNVSGESPLFVSVQEGHTDVVELLLDNKVDINKCENHEISPLFIACNKNSIEIVKLLLAKNANIDKCRDNGESPLFGACRNNNVDVIKLLLDKKADIDKFTDEGVSPLLIACQNNHIETLKLLIDNKANILKCADNKASPLYMACQNNHIEIVKLLLDNKAEINRPLDDRASPLFSAFQNNNKKILKNIQDNNTNINMC
ncbi:uncharacterized protein LOC134686468 [Mytilus trossulus]|uniref:uncharacterized protein LOC134686468 n=1 Tax=Mytilus trossulus TaxID=6551 RepID=UPI00300639EC